MTEQQPDFAALQRLSAAKAGIPREDFEQANRLVFGADRRGEAEDLKVAWGRMAELTDRWTVMLVAKALGPLNGEIRRLTGEIEAQDKTIRKMKAERKAMRKRIKGLREKRQ